MLNFIKSFFITKENRSNQLEYLKQRVEIFWKLILMINIEIILYVNTSELLNIDKDTSDNIIYGLVVILLFCFIGLYIRQLELNKYLERKA